MVADSSSSFNPARWPWLAPVAAIALTILAALAGLRLAGPTDGDTPIGRVSIEVSPSLDGSASAYVPIADWGVRADALDAPLELRAELRTLDREALGRLAVGDLSLLETTESRLEQLARDAVLRALGWIAAAAALLLAVATALWRNLRPRWILGACGALAAVALAGGSALVAQWSFDARAFQEPTYFARGGELNRILAVVEQTGVDSAYGSEFSSILRSIGAILTEPPAGRPQTRDVYLVSDLHANPLVVGPLARLVADDPVVAAGDFGQRGAGLEAAALAPRVAALGERVIAISGNHDSALLMERLDEAGVTVLEESRASVAIDGLEIAGYPDPLEWAGPGDPPTRPVTFDDLEDPEAALRAAQTDLVDWYDSLSSPADVVVVHQSNLALHLAETLHARGQDRPLTILTGHDHRQRVDRLGEIVVVNGGSVGAGGAFDAGDKAIGLARLHFERATPQLAAVELIAVEPFSGRAQGSRVSLRSLCPDEDTCSFEPPDPVLD